MYSTVRNLKLGKLTEEGIEYLRKYRPDSVKTKAFIRALILEAPTGNLGFLYTPLRKHFKKSKQSNIVLISSRLLGLFIFETIHS